MISPDQNFRNETQGESPLARTLQSRKIAVAAFLVVVSLSACARPLWCQTGQELRGLPNFGRVTDNLYRGGQPTPEGFSALRAMGVGIVVNFREGHKETAAEKNRVESLGMKYIGIPWSASRDPSSSQIVEFLDLVRANRNTKIFVHCRRGADRTGTMIASYRIAVEHKPVSEAVAEMHRFHYDWLLRPQLKRYVESLPELLQKDPHFADYRPQAKAAE
jgi:tyrosine-protein phosphatase SIW14